MTAMRTIAFPRPLATFVASPMARNLLLLAVGAAAGYLAGRSPAAPDARVRANEADEGPATVRMDTALATRAGVRTEPLAPSPFVPELALVGSVRFDESRVADVGGRVSGRVTRFFVELGDHVEEGQAVAEIEGAELGDAVAEYLGAQANLMAATRQAEREAGLGRQQLSTATAVEDARARAEALEASLRGAEQRLVAMGISPRSVRATEGGRGSSSRVVLRAPIAGEVVERFAVLGQVVDPTHPLLRIADLSQLWVQLEVYERDLGRVAEGDAAEIASDAYPGEIFRGTIGHIDATIDERTRTARVRVAVPNDDRRLRPGQFVRATLSPSVGSRMAFVLDPTSVLQIDGEPSVFVRRGPETYEVREVALGTSGDGVVEITAGLVSGENVVVAGAFALKSELAR